MVVLNDADQLSRQAQAALRRTMEKCLSKTSESWVTRVIFISISPTKARCVARYVGTCRIFMCVESLSKVIAPLRSRCVCLRIPAPSVEDVSNVLHQARREPSGFCKQGEAQISEQRARGRWRTMRS